MAVFNEFVDMLGSIKQKIEENKRLMKTKVVVQNFGKHLLP